jgi:hypothetical protein
LRFLSVFHFSNHRDCYIGQGDIMTIIRKINERQTKALEWLITNGGIGTFDQSGQTITANDKTCSYRRETWVGLRDANRIEFFNDGRATPFGGVRVIKEKTQ